jgi:hypothetical protein
MSGGTLTSTQSGGHRDAQRPRHHDKVRVVDATNA